MNKTFFTNIIGTILVLFTFPQEVWSGEKEVIPSFEKIVKEYRTSIPVGSTFYGCIESIYYSEKDAFTGDRKLGFVYISGAKQHGVYTNAELRVEEWLDILEKDSGAPKIGDCYAFDVVLIPTGKWSMGGSGMFVGIVKLHNGTFEVDNSFSKPEFRRKLTFTEFLEDGPLEYGSRIIEITGNIYRTENYSSFFKIDLFSEEFQVSGKDNLLNGYFWKERWIDSEPIKKRLLSIKEGDLLTLRGQFNGPNTYTYGMFEIIEIVD